MAQKNNSYFERQYITLFNVTIAFAFCALVTMAAFSSSRQEAAVAIAIAAVPLLGVVLLFYKMETTVTNGYVKVSFGIGLIRKSWKNDIVEFSASKNFKVPWYYGVGIRFLGDGVLYNAHPGNCVAFFNNKKQRYIYIGTKNKAGLEAYLKTSL